MQKSKVLHNNTSYNLYQGDLFSFIGDRLEAGPNGASIIVPHVCNNVNAFGAGFAAVLANRYQVVKENYHLIGPTVLKNSLGNVQFVEVEHNNKYKHKLIFANMIAQNGLKNTSNLRPLNYAALVQCMIKVKHYLKSLKKDDASERFEIHCPKFGAGLSGGRWEFISELIEDIWSDQKVFVYNYGINK